MTTQTSRPRRARAAPLDRLPQLGALSRSLRDPDLPDRRDRARGGVRALLWRLADASTAAFTAFGLFALPVGWLADKWSRRNMIAVYFFGTGICCALVGAADSFETLAIALFGVGLFAAIYHPVGTPMVVDAAVTRGRTMAFNGICGNIGVSIASGCTAVIASALGWRLPFFIPAVVFVLSGIAYLKFVPDYRTPRGAGAGPGRGAEQALTVAVVILFLILAFWVGLGVQRAHHHAAEAGRAARRRSTFRWPRSACSRPACSCAAAWRSSPWAAWSSAWCRI
jgi:MFS family permease